MSHLVCSVECRQLLGADSAANFFTCECDGLWQWTGRYQIPPSVRCEAWFGFCRRKTLDAVKFTEGLLQAMANMLWTRLVSENGAQCLRMSEQMFMTLRDQGDPSVITDALKQKVNRIIRENRHFTISEVYEQCPEVSCTVVYEIVTDHLQYQSWTGWIARRPSGKRRE